MSTDRRAKVLTVLSILNILAVLTNLYFAFRAHSEAQSAKAAAKQSIELNQRLQK